MYEQGATLTATFPADGNGDDDVLTVDNTDDFTAHPTTGTEVTIFTAAGSTVDRRVKVKTTTSITVADLPNTLPQYSGVKVKSNNDVFDAGLGRVDDAFGANSDGSDGGAFVEFPTLSSGNGSGSIPHYKSFPSDAVGRTFCEHWFSNMTSSDNTIQLVSADRHDDGSYGTSDPDNANNIVFVTVGQHTPGCGYNSDETVPHELCHQFGVRYATNSHADHSGANARVLNHAGTDFCLMSYEADFDDGNTEFETECFYQIRDAVDPR